MSTAKGYDKTILVKMQWKIRYVIEILSNKDADAFLIPIYQKRKTFHSQAWFNFFFFCINSYKKRTLWTTKNNSSRSLEPDGLILLFGKRHNDLLQRVTIRHQRKKEKLSLIMQYTEPYTRLTSYKRLRWSAAYKNDTDS